MPTLKFRGAIWASGAASDRQSTDGSMFLRSLDAGNGSFAVDALQLGADINLTDGWGMKFTLLTGQEAKVMNAASQQTGDVAFPEAQLVWTGSSDIVRIGRMYSPMGMEVLDQTQNSTASRGLLFTYALPFAQVGVSWHHVFNPIWSADGYLYNGEDRIQDNNRGKSAGVGVTYNHGGATDKFATLLVFSGAEQDGLGSQANTGAEGRKRQRLCLNGQWAWGPATLQWEGELAREAFPVKAIEGAQNKAEAKAPWSGFGLIYKYQLSPDWAGFARIESLKDARGVRLNADPSIATVYANSHTANLVATSLALGAERRWHATFTRLEIRKDNLNKPVTESASAGGKPFRDATSLTWSLGTSF